MVCPQLEYASYVECTCTCWMASTHARPVLKFLNHGQCQFTKVHSTKQRWTLWISGFFCTAWCKQALVSCIFFTGRFFVCFDVTAISILPKYVHCFSLYYLLIKCQACIQYCLYRIMSFQVCNSVRYHVFEVTSFHAKNWNFSDCAQPKRLWKITMLSGYSQLEEQQLMVLQSILHCKHGPVFSAMKWCY